MILGNKTVEKGVSCLCTICIICNDYNAMTKSHLVNKGVTHLTLTVENLWNLVKAERMVVVCVGIIMIFGVPVC